MQSKFATVLGAAALALSIVPNAAHAAKAYVYAVPFACGEAAEDDGAAVPGRYTTAITATLLERRDARLRARAELTVPERATSAPLRRTLTPLSPVTVHCGNIGDVFILPVPLEPTAYFQGVILLESTRQLDVQVQTTAIGMTGGPAIAQQTVTGMRLSRDSRWDRAESGSVELCHAPPGNPAAAHTIEVGQSAVAAHQAHGDELGPCAD